MNVSVPLVHPQLVDLATRARNPAVVMNLVQDQIVLVAIHVGDARCTLWSFGTWLATRRSAIVHAAALFRLAWYALSFARFTP